MPDSTPTLVILGATGDLTWRLLMPALYRLHCAKKLGELKIVGYAMEPWSRKRFVEHLEKGVRAFAPGFEAKVWSAFSRRLAYRSGDLSLEKLGALGALVTGPALFYLALPPSLFGEAAQGLGRAGFADERAGWRRLVVEKPFGYDLASAEALREQIHEYWRESQVYRIDHFLGKETTQNLLVFRLGNRFLEPVWNADNIAQVQITYAETLGLEGRWRYYDDAGALRDMLQNHLMQLFTLTAMEPPSFWDAEVLREHKVEVLRAVRPIPAEEVDAYAVRGQYRAGRIGDEAVPGYCEEEHIPDDSTTETFAALKLFVDNWRWKGVPFYLRSGKRLAADYAEIAVQFRAVPGRPLGAQLLPNNWLVFLMKPEERIDLLAVAKRPGLELLAHEIALGAPYRSAYSAYEQLLMDALEGDTTHFLRYDEVEWAWRILEPVLKAWQTGEPQGYPAGSQGPEAQARLMQKGQAWREIGRP